MLGSESRDVVLVLLPFVSSTTLGWSCGEHAGCPVLARRRERRAHEGGGLPILRDLLPNFPHHVRDHVCELGAGLSRARRQHLRVVRALLFALPLRLRLRGAQRGKLSVCPADDENCNFRRRAGFQAEGEGHRAVQPESAETLPNHRLFWRRCDQLGGVREAGAVTQAELLDEPIGVGVPRLIEPLRVPRQRRWPDHAFGVHRGRWTLAGQCEGLGHLAHGDQDRGLVRGSLQDPATSLAASG
mmetsp:Transcript_111892/g.266932  ORF Transcript_111892/g.266932 Transcript_111892/m.266932 type:complete len:243 (+) Transcript_111892:1036-1764(+)